MRARFFAVKQHRGVVAQDIDPAVLIERFFHHSRHLRFIGHIGGREYRFSTRITDGAHGGFPALSVDLGDHYQCSFTAEAFGDPAADARTCAGDDGDLVFQSHASLSSMLFSI